MKKIRSFIPLFLLVLIAYLSCKKNTSDPDGTYQPAYVTATISGRVTDDAQKPVSGAMVKAGADSATTDIDGSFTISNVTIDKNATYVKVVKEGFFLGTKTIVATANQNNQVAIRLIRKTLAGTFTASGGGTVAVPSNGGTIAFAANSIINPASNSAYTGTVAVSAFFINPEASNFSDIIPGTLRGINTNNQETGLQSFGMMAVELTGAAGEKLQLAPGKKATLHFPIPSTLQGEAPDTIPLWSLDERTGLWKEEGSATRQGTAYIANVSHFSFWNCDAPFPVIEFTGIIKNQQGDHLAGAEVMITVPAGNNPAGNISSSGFTNTEGVINGKIPAGKALQLKIYNKCHGLLYSQNIGPFTTNTDLGVVTVNAPLTLVTFSGTVKNCSNAAVTNGFVTINIEDNLYNVPVANGSFNMAISRCSNSATTAILTAYDANGHESGPEVSVPVSGNTVNAGTLVACGKPMDTYIKYDLNGVRYDLIPPADLISVVLSQNSSITSIFGFRQGQQEEEIVFMFSGGQTTGIHPVFIADVFPDRNPSYYRYEPFNANISEYGTTAGAYITGTFAGTLRDSLNNSTIPINCSFRVRR